MMHGLDFLNQIAAAGAAAATASTVAFSASSGNLTGILNFLRQQLLEIFGLKRKRRTWGVVYDSLTKRPLPFAKVQLLDAFSRVLETRFADAYGQYGFFISPKTMAAMTVAVQMLPTRDGFAFPSRRISPPRDTVLYASVYIGGVTTLDTSRVISFNIPMDPTHPTAVGIPSRAGAKFRSFLTLVAEIGFWLGLVLIPLNAILNPSLFHFGVLGVFILLNLFRWAGLHEKPFGIVIDSSTDKPMPFALLTLNDMIGKRVGFTVSDEQGRYIIFAPKGNYALSAYTSATVIPGRMSTINVADQNGWVTKEIKV